MYIPVCVTLHKIKCCCTAHISQAIAYALPVVISYNRCCTYLLLSQALLHRIHFPGHSVCAVFCHFMQQVLHVVGEGAYGLVMKCKVHGSEPPVYVAVKEFKTTVSIGLDWIGLDWNGIQNHGQYCVEVLEHCCVGTETGKPYTRIECRIGLDWIGLDWNSKPRSILC